jgi:dihydroneopterin aldolase
MIGEISLEGIEFFAYHGFYTEERKIGNKYQIDLALTADLGNSSTTDDLSETVDYEQVYKIIKREIEIPTKLLETIAHRILEGLMNSYPQIISGEVSVSKFNPPVGGICRIAKVKIKKLRVE